MYSEEFEDKYVKLGTDYGGWFVPRKLDFDENSIVYGVGVGEDISFDLNIHKRHKCNIVLIDPTEKAKKHFVETKLYYNNATYQFQGGIQPDYYKKIKRCNPDFKKFIYIPTGLWDKTDTLKFYKQENPNYVSQSLIQNMFTDNYDLVPVDTLKNIMNSLGHTKIDLLKLDIEGAENKVLNNMLDDNIFPTYLCIEFDLLMKKKDFNNETNTTIQRLLDNGYEIIVNDNLNITFQKK
jgi:FkbM family methyltransferase